MNYRFGKLENNSITYAPEYLNGDDGVIMNPTDEQYLSFGWKYVSIVQPSKPAGENKHWEINGYTETEDTIKAKWKAVDDPKVYRTFSKLNLEIALAKRSLLDKFDKFLDETLISGTNYAIRRFYNQANNLSEEHPMYGEYFESAKTALGITDEEAEEILQESLS